jgi:hypothetical protein
MTIAPSFPQNFMAAPIYCDTAVSPPESGPSAMTAKAIWFLLGRRNEPLASELIRIHSRCHDLATACLAPSLVASWRPRATGRDPRAGRRFAKLQIGGSNASSTADRKAER